MVTWAKFSSLIGYCGRNLMLSPLMCNEIFKIFIQFLHCCFIHFILS